MQDTESVFSELFWILYVSTGGISVKCAVQLYPIPPIGCPEMQPFEKSWDEITQFAETAEHVETIFHANRNEIDVINGAIVVKNLNTETRRRIGKSDFEYAYRLLEQEEELTLDDLEPELAGEKSIVLAILSEALELKTKKRPVTVYAN